MHTSSRDAEKEFMRTHYLLKPSVSLAILDAEEKLLTLRPINYFKRTAYGVHYLL